MAFGVYLKKAFFRFGKAFDKLKQIEDSWFDVFNENVENELLRRHLEIDKKVSSIFNE